MLGLKKFAHIGVGTRIYMAIGAIVALTVAASTVASLSFRRVDHTIDSLVGERYPVVEISRDLAQAAATAVAIAPKLADVHSEQERETIIARLGESDQRMRAIVDDLAARRAIDRERFASLIARLNAGVQQADAAARERIRMDEEKTKRGAALTRAGELFTQALTLGVDEAQFNLMIGLEDMSAAVNGRQMEDIKATLKSLADKDVAAYGSGLTLLAEGYQLYGLLREVLVLDRAELLVPALDRHRALSARVTKAKADADKVQKHPQRAAVTDGVLAFGQGEDSLFKLRERDFENRKALSASIAAAAEAANDLYSEIDKVVAEARASATGATKSAQSLISSSSLWLIVIGAVSVLIAGAIAFFIVRPQIVRRLARLSAETRAIADGNLETSVDAGGSDEIGAVARAVIEFRNGAMERRRLESEAAEQRRQVDEQRLQADEQRRQADDQRQQADEQRRQMELQRAQAEEQRREAEQERLRNEEERRASAEAQARAAEEQAVAMKALAEGLARLAEGDLTARLDEGFTEAYWRIRDDFNATIARLQETIGAIAEATREATNAAGEISASTVDLSTRTEEQAASLEQTSASMEEIAETVKRNAESAQRANQSAAGTQEVANRGGKVVADAIGAMARIEESSRRIADIIGVIDEIARQTNLLALNAAVEAARAGEAGRGFAVVASEVRSLAQRSSQAAKDIKDLISSSSGQVQEGVTLVNGAGKSLGEIVESIKSVASIVTAIATASSEQAVAIEQVNKTLSQMDEMTQQNSALVEENAATAKTLEQQANAMSERVSFFRMDAASALAPASSPAIVATRPAVAASIKRPVIARSPVGRMQAAAAAAFKNDEWKEF